MFRIKISEKNGIIKTWEINEYYFFIPIGLLADYLFISRFRKKREQQEKLQELQKTLNIAADRIKVLENQLEAAQKQLRLYKITAVGLGISSSTTIGLLTRGGSEIAEIITNNDKEFQSYFDALINSSITNSSELQSYFDALNSSTPLTDLVDICRPSQGISFVEDVNFVQEISRRLKYYRQLGGVIVMTSGTLCYLYKSYRDGLGITGGVSKTINWLTAGRAEVTDVTELTERTLLSIIWSAGILGIIQIPIRRDFQIVAGALLSIATAGFDYFLRYSSNLVETSSVPPGRADPRRKGLDEVIVLNFTEFLQELVKYFRNNWITPEKKIPYECFLAEQMFLNRNCQKKDAMTSEFPETFKSIIKRLIETGINPGKIVQVKDVRKKDPLVPTNEVLSDQAEVELLTYLLNLRGGSAKGLKVSPAVFLTQDPVFWMIYLEKVKRCYADFTRSPYTKARQFVMKKSQTLSKRAKHKMQRLKSKQIFRGSSLKRSKKLLQSIKSRKKRLQCLETDRVMLQIILGLTLWGFFGGSLLSTPGHSFHAPEFNQRPSMERVVVPKESQQNFQMQNSNRIAGKPKSNKPVEVSQHNPQPWEKPISDSFQKYGEGSYSSFPQARGETSKVAPNQSGTLHHQTPVEQTISDSFQKYGEGSYSSFPKPRVAPTQSKPSHRLTPAQRYKQRRNQILAVKQQRAAEDQKFATDFEKNQEQYPRNISNSSEQIRIGIPRNTSNSSE